MEFIRILTKNIFYNIILKICASITISIKKKKSRKFSLEIFFEKFNKQLSWPHRPYRLWQKLSKYISLIKKSYQKGADPCSLFFLEDWKINFMLIFLIFWWKLDYRYLGYTFPTWAKTVIDWYIYIRST